MINDQIFLSKCVFTDIINQRIFECFSRIDFQMANRDLEIPFERWTFKCLLDQITVFLMYSLSGNSTREYVIVCIKKYITDHIDVQCELCVYTGFRPHMSIIVSGFETET